MKRTKRTGITVAAAVLAAVTLGAGCSSSAKSGSSATSRTATTSAPTSAPATGDTITIKNFAFGAPITVKAGATVTVVNDGDQTHTLSADDTSSFDTGPLVGGKTATFVAPADPGVYKFHCNIHDMHGSLQVIA